MIGRRLAVASRIASSLFVFTWIFLALFDHHVPSRIVSEIIVFSIAILSWFFIISYHILSKNDEVPWWGNEMGRHIMTFVTVDASIFSFLGGAILWPRLAIYTWYMWLYFGTVSGMAWVMLWRISILYRPSFRLSDTESDMVKEDE